MMEQIIAAISPLNTNAMRVCQERIDNLTKPLNSLQGFEQLAVQLAGITGDSRPQELKAELVLMAGDEGVEECKGAKELVQEFYQGVCPVQVAAEHVSADIMLVDIGVAVDLTALPIVHEKIAYGTKNITKEAAMSHEEARRAVAAGIKIAQEAVFKGYSVLGIGGLRAEDSLASLAVIAEYSEKAAAELTDVKALEAALKVNAVNADDPWDILSKVGSFEIAGLVGVILGAAAGKIAVVLDGLLASAAALVAVRLAPYSKAYLIGSHQLPCPIHKAALDILKLPVYLELDLTVGQGFGAALGISLLHAALHMLNDMKTFNEAKVTVAEDGPGAVKQKA